jgi:type I restriction enzyme S subunit
MLSSQNVFNRQIDYSASRYVTKEAYIQELKRTPIEPNDVLLTIVASIGRSAIVPKDFKPFCLQRSVALLKTIIPPFYLPIFFDSPVVVKYFEENAKGTAQKGIYLGQLNKIPFPLPPLAEQKRIVAKVDACFAKLDATDAQLAHAERLVGQCRKSILNQAVRGQLLPQDANDEPAIELLKRIQAEKPVSKKTRHPEHREGSPERGVAGGGEILRCTQDDGVGGVEHPPFEIPPSWVWTRLGEVCDLQNGFAFKSDLFKTSGLPVLRISSIQNMEICDKRPVFIHSEDYNEDLSKYLVKQGDLVIAMSGATTGKVGFNNSSQEFILNQRVGLFRTKTALELMYLFYFLLGRVEENLQVSTGSAQPNLSTEQIKYTTLPLPPLAEQKRIVAKVDACFAKLDALAEQLKTQRQHIQHSKKALLQRAVSGRLVPQIPEEGTGHDLLKQIQAEKQKQTKATTKKGKSL